MGIRVALATFDELVRRWEAQVPMGVLRTLYEFQFASPLTPHSTTAAFTHTPELGIQRRLRRLRDRYERYYVEVQHLRVCRASTPCTVMS